MEAQCREQTTTDPSPGLWPQLADGGKGGFS